MKEPLHESDIQTVFDVFDQDGDTFISPEEMHRTFLSLGVDLTAQELNGIFEQYDHDYDGLICFDGLFLVHGFWWANKNCESVWKCMELVCENSYSF